MLKQDNLIAGVSLQNHLDELTSRLYIEYLPFWHPHAFNPQKGGFQCHLETNGVPVDDQVFIWYQSRALWVYSYLYNNFGQDPKYLEIADRLHDFLVNHMYAGNGRWHKMADTNGNITKPDKPSADIYGWLFAASGLIEYYLATKNEKDLELAKLSIHTADQAYENPNYRKGTPDEGLRIQGHSMLFMWVITQLLRFDQDSALTKLWNHHIENIMTRFYHPTYRISNETLNRDYSRIKGVEKTMFLGHTLETQWMVMEAALIKQDKGLFNDAKDHFHRYLDMGWDHVFDGWGSGDYHVFGGPDTFQGPDYNLKTMWAHTEILIGCMMVREHCDEYWARDYYDKTWDYVKKKICRGIGAWEQAVDRFGEPLSREKNGVHPMRRGNFHQPRFLMMNMKSLQRILTKNQNTE